MTTLLILEYKHITTFHHENQGAKGKIFFAVRWVGFIERQYLYIARREGQFVN